MSVGNLVRITRAGVGVPVNTLGLIVESWQMPYTILHGVKLLDGSKRIRRCVPGDLEIISS